MSETKSAEAQIKETKKLFFKRQTRKRTELLGDALLRAMLIDYFIRRNMKRKEITPIVNEAIKNDTLHKVSKHCGLLPPNYCNGKKRFADMYEYTLGKKFRKNGYEHAYQWLVETLVEYLMEKGKLERLKTEL